MRPRLDPILALGRKLADVERTALGPTDTLRVVRQRMLHARKTQWRSEWLRNAAFALAGAALAVVVIIATRRSIPEVYFRFEDGNAKLGAPLLATQPSGGSLTFSDGSTIGLEHDSLARVTSIDPLGARVAIERGNAEVHVIHRAGTHWTLAAGPYEVKVTGTRFRMGWDPSARRLHIQMHDGAVVLTGCSVSTVELTNGQAIEATCDDQEAKTVPESRAVPVASAQPVPPMTPSLRAASEPTDTREAAPSAQVDAAPADSRWKQLAAAGKLREAFASAEAGGFESECASASASELLTLSDAALVAGRADRARLALLAVRTRYAKSAPAAAAAFRLGRLAFDHAGAYGEARSWFNTYLSEQPGGQFAREAWGRLLEVEQRSGNGLEARRLATRYLQSWPDGPHAPLARSLVGD